MAGAGNMRRGWAAMLMGGMAVLALVIVVIVAANGSDGHTVRMTVPTAGHVQPGFDVRLAGRPVGSVKSVDLTDRYGVELELEIDDEAWPLPKDTRFQEKLGGTIQYTNEFIEILPGRSREQLADGATVPARNYQQAVRFDEIFNVFDGPTRKDLGALLDNGGRAAPLVERHLARGLRRSPAAAASVDAVLRQLGGDPRALRTLTRSTTGVAGAVVRANPGVGELVRDAGTTLAAIASRNRALESTLEQAPTTLVQARNSAGRVNTALDAVGDLTDRLGPGVGRLRAIAPHLSHLLRTVRRVGPDARVTLATLARSAPDLTRLLGRARTPLLSRVGPIAKAATPQVNCIRPYAPDIASFFSTWTGFFSRGDAKDKFFRAAAGVTGQMNETPVPAGVYRSLVGNSFKMAFPRPPGQNAGQPWFQPQCGITEDALDNDKDPEGQNVDPLAKKLVNFETKEGE